MTEPGPLARQAYTQELEDLEHDVLEMAMHVESMVVRAVDSLCRLDIDLARKVLADDDEVDDEDLEIQERCLRLLAQQQPVGKDFRTVGTIMRMLVDIERVGDLAVDIAKCGMKIDTELGTSDFVDIRKMAEVVRAMFNASITAFVKKDTEIVAQIASWENEVDDLYRDLRSQIHDNMRLHPEDVVAASWMLLVVHHLERIADHSVNIAERVMFMTTGKLAHITTRSEHTE